MWYYFEKIKQFFTPIGQFRYFVYRIRRILTDDEHMSLVRKAQLKSDMGLRWNEKEQAAMKKQIESTIVPCTNGDSCIYCKH